MGSTLYESIGGTETCRKLSAAFYTRVGRDPVLRRLFPRSLKCPIELLGDFLTQFVGGPCEYSPRRWSLSLLEAHSRFDIGPKERDAWLKNMSQAMEEVQIEEPARRALQWFFEQSSALLINQPIPFGQSPQEEIAQRWEVQLVLEQAVRAVREGNGRAAIAMTDGPVLQAYFLRDRAAFLSLLAVMSSGEELFIDYVQEKLLSCPELVRERYTYNRTLLHDAASQGSLDTVKLLLEMGADPNAEDKFGHMPLYGVGNWCSRETGPDVIRALVTAGANIDGQDKVKRCTALHMAARRGNLQVAQALLDCGASLEVRDIAGDTPLRRAVNCAKVEVAELLLARGADVHSVGNRGLAVWQAARGAAMKQLVRAYI